MQLPSFNSVLESMALAHQQDGWLSKCEDAGQFLALNREFVTTLTGFLQTIAGEDSILEVCAGSGELAEMIGSAGQRIIATDIGPASNSVVVEASAVEALDRWRPSIVLGCFVPFDANVDREVLSRDFVRHYLVLNARLGGQFGSELLWTNPQWHAKPLLDISRWMICRQDVWIGSRQAILQHGEVWHLYRKQRVCS